MKKASVAALLVFVAWFAAQRKSVAQHAPDAAPVLTISARTSDEVQQWEPLLENWQRQRALVMRTQFSDSEIAGRRHETLIQLHRGVPVYGGELSRQREGGATISLFGTIYSGINVDPAPRLTRAEAVDRLEALSGSAVAITNEPELVVLPTLDGDFVLAYRATMLDAATYFVDAVDGRELLRLNETKYQAAVGSGRGVLGDTKKVSATLLTGAYRAQDSLRPASVITLDARGSLAAYDRLRMGGAWLQSDIASDADNNWTQSAVVDAHVHTGWVYDYFYKNHGYQGLNNRNGAIVGVVATRSLLSNNAFFTPPPFGPGGGGGMVYGELSSGIPVTALDVVGHELMHGVTHFSLTQRTGRRLGSQPTQLGPSTIVVNGRSFSCSQTSFAGRPFLCSDGRYVTVSDHAGAIDEGVSDVFGTAVEFAYHPAGNGLQRAEYLIGEDLGGSPFRSLQEPSSMSFAPGFRYPDHYSRTVNFGIVILSNRTLAVVPLAIVGTDATVLDDIDDGAVHLNATLLGHAYFLAVQGGRNRISGITVQGVGHGNRVHVERVFLRAIRDMFPSSVTFQQAGAILRQASVDLHGTSSPITAAINQALAAVGL